jgi:lipopolysaccharide transport system ATP-binding protein
VYSLGLSGRTESLATILKQRLRHPFTAGSKRERFHALDDVTFDVMPGEVVGVVGRNGAGKSTLLKILSRITPPSAGYVELGGSVGSLLEVGTGFHPELTGIENVYLNGTILGMSKRDIDSRLEAIVDFSEVHKFLETPVKRYSSGMRVRLAFAVAAHLEPEILIIDEVLSVGDSAFQAKCLDKMRAIAGEDGRTVLYVSHNLVTVEHLCPRSILLVDGRLVFDGDTADTLRRYLRSVPHEEHGVSPGVFDLTGVDRTESGFDNVLQRVVLRPDRGVPANTIGMGDPLRIEIEVEGLDATPDAGMIVTIGSDSAQCLFRLTSRAVRPTIAHPRCPRETIVIDVPSIQLTPGDYHLDVSVGVDPRIGRGTIDEVQHAATFSVAATDVFGTGHRYGRHDGVFVVPWEWEVRPTAAETRPVPDVTVG